MSYRESVVNKLTSYLRRLSRTRSTRVVTADDAQRFLDRTLTNAASQDERLSFIRTVLASPTFESVGRRPSSRPVAKGRLVTEWKATA